MTFIYYLVRDKIQKELATPTLATTIHYADLQLVCSKRGKTLSQNELWVAALAREAGEKLVTFDKDFEALKEELGEKLILV